MSLFDHKLPPNCTVVLCIYDCSQLGKDVQPSLLHRAEIQNSDVTFPIAYEINYPQPECVKGSVDTTLFHMSVRIFHNDKILYTNNCKDVIGKNMKFRKYLDVYLYYLPFYNAAKED